MTRHAAGSGSVVSEAVGVDVADVNEQKKLQSCSWPSIRNDERLYGLSKTWAKWQGMELSNFIRVSVAFFIVFCFMVELFKTEGVAALHKIDRVLPLDQ